MRQWIIQQGTVFYVMSAVTLLGIIMTAIANGVYKRLVREADDVENSSNRLVKYIKLKYSSYYKIGLKPNDMKAMVHKYFQKYRLGPLSLKLWSKTGILAAGIVGITAMVYMLLEFNGGARISDMYVMLTEAVLGIFILSLQYALYSFGAKQEAFCWAMYDYLANFLKNKIENGKTVLAEEEKIEAESRHERKHDRSFRGDEQVAATSAPYSKSVERSGKKDRRSYDEDEIDAKIVEDILREFLV